MMFLIIKLLHTATILIGAIKNTPGLQQILEIFGNLEDAKTIAHMYLKLLKIFSGMCSVLKEALQKNLEGIDGAKDSYLEFRTCCATKLLMHVKLFCNKKKLGCKVPSE